MVTEGRQPEFLPRAENERGGLSPYLGLVCSCSAARGVLPPRDVSQCPLRRAREVGEDDYVVHGQCALLKIDCTVITYDEQMLALPLLHQRGRRLPPTVLCKRRSAIVLGPGSAAAAQTSGFVLEHEWPQPLRCLSRSPAEEVSAATDRRTRK